MTDNGREATLLLKYAVDEAGLRRLAQANESVKRQLVALGQIKVDPKLIQRAALEIQVVGNKLQTATAKVDELHHTLSLVPQGTKDWDHVNAALANARLEAAKFEDQLQAIPARLQAIERAAQDAAAQAARLAESQAEAQRRANAQQAAGVRTGRLGAIDRLGTFGSQIASGLGFGEIANLAGLVGDISGAAEALPQVAAGLNATTAAATTTTAAVAPAAVSLTALAGAAAIVAAPILIIVKLISDMQSSAAEAAEETRRLIEAQRATAEFARTATSEQAEQRRIQAQADLDAANAEIAHLQAVRDQAQTEIDNLNLGVFTGAVLAIQGANTPLIQLDQALEEASTQARNAETALQGLASAETQLTIATNDQVVALQGRIQADIDAAEAVRTMSSEAAQVRRTAIQEEIDAITASLPELSALVDGNENAALAYQEATGRLAELSQEMVRLNTEIIPGIRAREQEAQAAARATEALSRSVANREQAAAAEGRALEEIANVEEQTVERRKTVIQSYADQTAKIEENRRIADTRAAFDFANKRLADIRKFNEQEIASEREFFERQQQATTKQNEQFYREQQRALERHQDRLEEIMSGAQRDVIRAAARLDVDAAQAAVDRAQTAIKAENKTYNEESRARQERAEEVAAAVQDELTQFRAGQEARRAAFQAQLDEEDNARKLAADRQREDRKREDDERKAARDKALKDLRDGLIEQVQTRKNALNDELAALENFGAKAVNVINTAAGQLSRGLTSALNGGSTFTGAKASSYNSGSSVGSSLTKAATASPVTRTVSPSTTSTVSAASAARANLVSAINAAKASGTLRQFAEGGTPPVGEPVWVGERGPEPVIFGSPARIYPNSMAGSFGSSFIVDVGGIVVNGGNNDVRQIVAEVERQLIPRIIQTAEQAKQILLRR